MFQFGPREVASAIIHKALGQIKRLITGHVLHMHMHVVYVKPVNNQECGRTRANSKVRLAMTERALRHDGTRGRTCTKVCQNKDKWCQRWARGTSTVDVAFSAMNCNTILHDWGFRTLIRCIDNQEHHRTCNSGRFRFPRPRASGDCELSIWCVEWLLLMCVMLVPETLVVRKTL